MKAFWKKTVQQVAELNQREKILLLLAGLILIPGVLDFFLLQPLRDNSTQWRQQVQIINQRMVSFSTQQDELLVEMEKDPAMEIERRIEGITKALGLAKQSLVQYTDTLIAPDKMATMLENMLHERGSLELVSLENLPVAPLFNQPADTAKKVQQTEDVFGLYRHGIRLVFKGNYMTTLDYLKNLEQLPWKFYWQNFNYEVQQYPTGLITLNVYTLSTSKWWIGDKDEL